LAIGTVCETNRQEKGGEKVGCFHREKISIKKYQVIQLVSHKNKKKAGLSKPAL
jgi:hypothetical protein